MPHYYSMYFYTDLRKKNLSLSQLWDGGCYNSVDVDGCDAVVRTLREAIVSYSRYARSWDYIERSECNANEDDDSWVFDDCGYFLHKRFYCFTPRSVNYIKQSKLLTGAIEEIGSRSSAEALVQRANEILHRHVYRHMPFNFFARHFSVQISYSYATTVRNRWMSRCLSYKR